MIFFGNSSVLGVGQGKDFKLIITTELSEKSAITPQPGNQKRLKWSNTA